MKMKEFMLLISNRAGHDEQWPQEKHKEFLAKCEKYIGKLKKEGKLLAAQPLAREGMIISGSSKELKDSPFDKTGKVQVGYYHILAKSMDEAVSIAKKNPEFEFSTTARIEVRPVKTKEKNTGFVYPKNKTM